MSIEREKQVAAEAAAELVENGMTVGLGTGSTVAYLLPALHAPVPLELLSFGLRATMRRVGPASLRDAPMSPDGGVIADYHGPVGDPAELAARLSATPGVVDHGLFPPQMVATVLVGRGESADRIDFTSGS